MQHLCARPAFFGVIQHLFNSRQGTQRGDAGGVGMRGHGDGGCRTCGVMLFFVCFWFFLLLGKEKAKLEN